MSRSNIVIVPGWNGSGPAHWQTIWERDHPEYVRVTQSGLWTGLSYRFAATWFW